MLDKIIANLKTRKGRAKAYAALVAVVGYLALKGVIDGDDVNLILTVAGLVLMGEGAQPVAARRKAKRNP